MALKGGLLVTFYAFVALVFIQTGIGAINKIAILEGGGHYNFAPTAALAMAEFAKLMISIALHVYDFEGHRTSSKSSSGIPPPLNLKATAAYNEFVTNISDQPTCVLHLFSLASLYLFNNQLNFFTNGVADPGTIFLFKSGSTLITALMMLVFLGRPINENQWCAIVLQVVGLIVVQYDPCRGQALLPAYIYCWMAFSTVISATTGVRNDYMLKNFKMTMHVQNIILYSCGVFLNVSAFMLVPPWLTHTKPGLGFFDGFDSTSAKLVVLFNAFIGIAISAVFKYADAVIKTFATASTTVLLVIFSAAFLGVNTTITAWCGVIVVIIATYLYSKMTVKAVAATAHTKGDTPVNTPKAGNFTSIEMPEVEVELLTGKGANSL